MRLLIMTAEEIMATLWEAAFSDDENYEVIAVETDPHRVSDHAESADLALICVVRYADEGLEWVRQIKQDSPDLKIVVVGVTFEQPILLSYIEAGASGFIPPDADMQQARKHLEGIYQGEARMDGDLIPALIERLRALRSSYVEPDTDGRRLKLLTPREQEVLGLIAKKMTNREIADTLVIEVGTVKNHVHSILEKLEFDSRYEAAAYYLTNSTSVPRMIH